MHSTRIPQSAAPLRPVMAALLFIGMACSPDAREPKQPRIFEAVTPSVSGIRFENLLNEDSAVNYFTYPYIYMGGGVAVGDINNDGLADIYFTGNRVKNRLYLNKGNLQFEDITDRAGVGSDGRWHTGITMADVNNDGWLDIYVSVAGIWATRKNLLYINNGDLTFTEMAEAYGIADAGATTQATFFDYDGDGYLDLYTINYPPTSFQTMMATYRYMMNTVKLEDSDRLYRNNGDGTFSDATDAAGLRSFGLSLSATVCDFNLDGRPDLFVSNDFATPDYYYLNNGDGTFRECSREMMRHTAFYGMGADAADINNDGWPDFIQLDMTPEDNYRAKANMAAMEPETFRTAVALGLHHQYMLNMLQLHAGIGPDGLPRFSEIAQMAGVDKTDWSWGPLLADFDNDGWKDMFVSNGTRREINNKDFFRSINESYYFGNQENRSPLELTLLLPSEKIEKYIYRNRGDLTFEKAMDYWGLSFVGFTNGSAYADLDNDGDLDLVLNNLDTVSVVFRNLASDQGLHHYLRFRLEGPPANPSGLGTRIDLTAGGMRQHQQLTLSRGFQSSSDPVVHFGLGRSELAETVEVRWPDGRIQRLTGVAADQIVTLRHRDAGEPEVAEPATAADPLFRDITAEAGLRHRHVENHYDDFRLEPLLPHKNSEFGPRMAVADVNGDGLDDLFVGASVDSAGALYLQRPGGAFRLSPSRPWEADKACEDLGAVFFDADGDGDVDLYVVSGGNEYAPGAPEYRDRLYLNDGSGRFEKAEHALPDIRDSGMCVAVCDFDGDGDADLFVGGRLVPRQYPLAPGSRLLRNDSDAGGVRFTDVTAGLAPALAGTGMVTSALWTDIDGDGDPDLVLAGQWMSIRVFVNEAAKLTERTRALGLAGTEGWWFALAAADIDGDGDTDLIAGNLGLNYRLKSPIDLYAYDFDRNERLDIAIGYTQNGEVWPLHEKSFVAQQIPAINDKFPDYTSYARASLEDVYSRRDLRRALHFRALEFATCIAENQGDGRFRLRPLPNEAQISAVNGILVRDFDGDGRPDLLLAGNLHATDAESVRADASYGHFLWGDGQGGFTPVPNAACGLFISGVVSQLLPLQLGEGRTAVVAARNNDYLMLIGTALPPR
jgi:enediyne biosynthesis protein E4